MSSRTSSRSSSYVSKSTRSSAPSSRSSSNASKRSTSAEKPAASGSLPVPELGGNTASVPKVSSGNVSPRKESVAVEPPQDDDPTTSKSASPSQKTSVAPSSRRESPQPTPRADAKRDEPSRGRSGASSAQPTPRARASSTPATSAANTPRAQGKSKVSSKASSRSTSASSSRSHSPRAQSASPATSRASSRPPTGSARNAVKAVAAQRSGAASRRNSNAEEGAAAVAGGGGALTADEQAQWKALENDNKRLVLRLAELNTSLDKQLSKQGITLPSRPGGAAAAAGISPSSALSPASDVAKLKHRIDTLRKANGEMQKALKEHAAIKGSAFDLKNRHAQLVKELEALRSDNQSLENVYNNQTCKTSQDERAKGELNRMRSEHNDVQRESREASRQLKELRESEMANLRILLKQQDMINEKLKFLAEERASIIVAGGSPGSDKEGSALLAVPTQGRYALPASVKSPYDIAELQALLQSLTTEEADTLKDINNLTGRVGKARWKQVADRKGAELEDLKDELKLLREHADAKRIAY